MALKAVKEDTREFVRYTGTASTREISRKQWAAVGADQDAIEWSFRNSYKVAKSVFTPEALHYLLHVDERRSFQVVAE